MSKQEKHLVVDLHQALRSKNLAAIHQLLQTGTNVNIPLRGTTPLSLSIQTNSPSTTSLLLRHGADVNQLSRDHLDRLEPPLYTACRLGLHQIATILVQSDADLDKPDWYGQTPLWVAVRERRLDLVRLLLQNGARLGRVTTWSDCPLYLATKYLYFGRREIAILLTMGGCCADHADGAGRNSLYWALKNGDRELAFLLGMAGARCGVGWDWGALEEAYGGFWEWVEGERRGVASLKRLSRLCVRRRLVRVNCGLVGRFVDSLDVPLQIKEYLKLERN